MPGFPSYCAGSLLMITSSITFCRCSCIGHHVILHTRPDSRPNQVHLRYVPSTSYRFLQTPSLADDALASRILFPMNRVRPPAIADGWVCQLRWANKMAAGAELLRRPGVAGECENALQHGATSGRSARLCVRQIINGRGGRLDQLGRWFPLFVPRQA